MKKAKSTAVAIRVDDRREMAFGGGLEGAERTKRETVMWTPPMVSPDTSTS